MPDYEITDPNGQKFVITAPEGATEAQVLEYAQANMPKERRRAQWGDAGSMLSAADAFGAVNAALDKLSFGAGAKVTDAAAQVLPPEAAAAAGAAANVATGQAIPMAVGGAGGLLAKAPLRGTAEWLMQSALKPTVKALKNEGVTGVSAPRAIDTMLEEGITVSRGGIEKLQGKIDALSSSITDALKNSGASVDRNAIAARLQDVISRIERTSLNPQDRVAEVERIYTQVLSDTSKGRFIPVERAQEIKQGIYQMLKDKYGQLGSDSVEAQKALARGAKEEISAAVPGVAQLNAKEAELINALQLAQHRAFVTGNKDIGGLAWLTLNPAQFAAFMADRSPLFKSIVAQMMNKASQNAPGLGAAAGAAMSPNNAPQQ